MQLGKASFFPSLSNMSRGNIYVTFTFIDKILKIWHNNFFFFFLINYMA